MPQASPFREAVFLESLRLRPSALAVLRAVRLKPLWPHRERMVLRGTALVPHRSVPMLVSDRASFRPPQSG